MTFGVSRFISARRASHAIIALAAAVAALMVRNEAAYLAVFSFFMLMAAAWPDRRALLVAAGAGAAAFALVMAWSVERAAIMHDPRLIGSLNNSTGQQLFWRIYVQSGESDRDWQLHSWRCVRDRYPEPDCARGPTRDHVIHPENGPASRRLGEIVRDWGARSGYDPDQFIADYFAYPSGAGMGERVDPRLDKKAVAVNEAIRLFGLKGADDFLKQVCIEAMVAHHEAVYSMAASTSFYFGMSFMGLVHFMRSPTISGFPFFANWGGDAYETFPVNFADQAHLSMTPALWRAYLRAGEKSASSLDSELLSLGRLAHNIVRNTIGLTVLVTLPALLFARDRLLAFYLFGCFGLLLAAYAMGFGYNMRMEHPLFSLMVMVWIPAADVLIRKIAASARRLHLTMRGAPR